MLKPELVRAVAENCAHLKQVDVEKVVDTLFEEIAAALQRGDRVELRGFGVFSVTRREAHNGRNPRTGQAVSVPSKAFPAFKTGQRLHQRLNTPKSHV